MPLGDGQTQGLTVAVIPARGGSKRIPGKNIRTFFGQPIISYSIAAAFQAGVFDRVLVSTDSPTIAEVARSYGAETPFLRPAEISDDVTGVDDVLLHAASWLTEHVGAVEALCCIYATAPFVQAEYLRLGLDVLRRTGAQSVISVTSFASPVFRALREDEDGNLGMIWPEYYAASSNELPEALHDAGQFMWLLADAFARTRQLFPASTRGVRLPRHLVQDMDTPEDWKRAELMYRVCRELALVSPPSPPLTQHS